MLVSVAGNCEPYMGVTIGPVVTNLLSPSDLADFLCTQHITRVRLYDADRRGHPNDVSGSSSATTTVWVARCMLPFAGVISAIAVGDEEPTAFPSTLLVLLSAIRSLIAALAAVNLSSIPVSMSLSFSMVDPFPPLQAFFNQSLAKSFAVPLLAHLTLRWCLQ